MRLSIGESWPTMANSVGVRSQCADVESRISALRDGLAYEERAFEDCDELDRERSGKEKRRDAYRRVCEKVT